MLLEIPLKKGMKVKAGLGLDDGVLSPSENEPKEILKVSLWVDPATGNIKFRNQDTRPGRVIRRVIEKRDGSELSDVEVKQLAEFIKENITRYEVRFAETRDEIRHVYEHGPNSCMKSILVVAENGDWIHPAEAYATDDFRVAYLIDMAQIDDETENPKIVARSVIGMVNRKYSRIYGLASVLESHLKKMYFSKAHSFRNHRLLAIETECDAWLAPYVDTDYSADLSECGKWLVIRDCGEFSIRNETGTTFDDHLCGCEHCGTMIREHEGNWINEEMICDSCANDYVVDAEDPHWDRHIHVNDAVSIRGNDGLLYHFRGDSQNIAYCEMTGSPICTDCEILEMDYFVDQGIDRDGVYRELVLSQDAADSHFRTIAIADGEYIENDISLIHVDAVARCRNEGEIYTDCFDGRELEVYQIDCDYLRAGDSEGLESELDPEWDATWLETDSINPRDPESKYSHIYKTVYNIVSGYSRYEAWYRNEIVYTWNIPPHDLDAYCGNNEARPDPNDDIFYVNVGQPDGTIYLGKSIVVRMNIPAGREIRKLRQRQKEITAAAVN